MKLNGIRSFVTSLLGHAGSGRSRAGSRGARLGRNGESCEERVLLTVDFSLVQDSVTTPNFDTAYNTGFKSTTDASGRLYFAIQDGVHGLEVWTSDGTVAGTHLLKDINPGINNSFPLFFASNHNTTYFWATDPDYGQQLFRTDGTEAGTTRLTSLGNVTYDADTTCVGDTLYFTVVDNNVTNHRQLWKTDGTPAGTAMTADLGVGFFESTTFGGECYFKWNSSTASQLWKVDSNSGQAVLVKEVGGTSNANISDLVATDDRLYFFGNDGVHGMELWTSDGTSDGTVMVKDLDPGSSSGVLYPDLLRPFGSSVVFTGKGGVWISDGTSSGTVLLNSISATSNVQVYQGRMYFDGKDATYGDQPWTSDGTVAGTFRLATNAYGPNLDFQELGGWVYFVSGLDLWKTDGSIAGTTKVTSLPNTMWSGMSPVISRNGNLLSFTMLNLPNQSELWISDGTSAGTLRMTEAIPEFSGKRSVLEFAGSGGGYFYYYEAVPTGGFNFWIADPAGTGHAVNVGRIDVRTQGSKSTSFAALGNFLFEARPGNELWKSDGTLAGTVQVTTLPGFFYVVSANSGAAVSPNGLLYLVVTDAAHGEELWKTDGTSAGTVMVKDIHPGTEGSGPEAFAVLNGKVLFVADDGVHGPELWTSDGTEAGTQLVSDITPGTNSGISGGYTISPEGSVAYFLANDGTHGREWWRTDGTTAGTWMVKDMIAGIQSPVMFRNDAVLWNGSLYFNVFTAETGRELWRLNVTTGVAEALTEINPGISDSDPSDFAVVNGKLLFEAYDGVHSKSLWTIDETTGQPALLHGFGTSGQTYGIMTSLQPSGGKVYFVIRGANATRELWVSDGTVAGTSLIKIFTYSSGAAWTPSYLLDLQGTMYFWDRKPNSLYSYELWKTDGTVGGTVRVSDTVAKPMPEVMDSALTGGINLNGVGLWLIDDSVHGTEWWSMRSIPESVGVFRDGKFYLDGDGSNGWKVTGNAVTDKSFAFGIAGDKPVAGDWNGDGAKDIGVFRNGVWFFDQNGNYKWNGIAGGDVTFNFGTAGDTPITGDWNGDGVTDVGVVRNGTFYLDVNGSRKWDAGDVSFKFGNVGDKPVTGDWNGDGKTDVGVMRGATWFLDQDGSRKWSAGDVSFNFGTAGDTPVTGDWNVDGKTDVGVYRSGFYYIDKNGNRKWDASDVRFGFGTAGDAPVTGTWNLGAPNVVPPPAPAALVVQAPAAAVVVSGVEPAVAQKVKSHGKKHAHKGKS